MIAVDTNILVFAHRSGLPWHEPARDLIEGLSRASAPWAVPMHCLHEFYSTITRRKPLLNPTSQEVALEQVDSLLATDNLIVLTEDGDHWRILHSLVAAGAVAGPMIHDARIAACCLRHGVSELWTADRDFSRFPALRTRNPLIAVNERRPRYR
jgi:uncharacterized protein